jgi:hypothetical protein
MKLFILVIISAALGLLTSILLYELFNIDFPPLFIGLTINAIGYYIFRKELE